MTKSIDALKTIARYVEAKKPKTLAEAEHMLDLISVIADETVLDEDVAGSSRRPAAYAIDANSIGSTLQRIDGYLVRWARRKHKRLRERPKGTRDWLARVRRADPNLFAHWRLGPVQEFLNRGTGRGFPV
jgi:hypothetical protein